MHGNAERERVRFLRWHREPQPQPAAPHDAQDRPARRHRRTRILEPHRHRARRWRAQREIGDVVARGLHVRALRGDRRRGALRSGLGPLQAELRLLERGARRHAIRDRLGLERDLAPAVLDVHLGLAPRRAGGTECGLGGAQLFLHRLLIHRCDDLVRGDGIPDAHDDRRDHALESRRDVDGVRRGDHADVAARHRRGIDHRHRRARIAGRDLRCRLRRSIATARGEDEQQALHALPPTV